MRGEIWDAFFPAPLGEHPVVVVTSNALIPRLGAITAVLVTGTEGPETTHVPLNGGAGVTKYALSWANTTDLHSVPRARFRRRRGLLSPAELQAVEHSLRLVLAL